MSGELSMHMILVQRGLLLEYPFLSLNVEPELSILVNCLMTELPFKVQYLSTLCQSLISICVRKSCKSFLGQVYHHLRPLCQLVSSSSSSSKRDRILGLTCTACLYVAEQYFYLLPLFNALGIIVGLLPTNGLEDGVPLFDSVSGKWGSSRGCLFGYTILFCCSL